MSLKWIAGAAVLFFFIGFIGSSRLLVQAQDGANQPESEVISADNVSRLYPAQTYGRGRIYRMIWSPNGEWLALLTSVGLWRLDVDNLAEPVLIGNPYLVEYRGFEYSYHISAAPNGDWLAVTHGQGKMSIWDMRAEAGQGVPHVVFKNAESLQFSRDGTQLAVLTRRTSEDPPQIVILESLTWQVTQTWPFDVYGVSDMVFSPDGNDLHVLVSGSSSQQSIYAIELSTGSRTQLHDFTDADLSYIGWPDDHFYGIGMVDFRMSVFDLNNAGTSTPLSENPRFNKNDCNVAPDLDFVSCRSGRSETMYIFDIVNGTAQQLPYRDVPPRLMQTSPGGDYLAVYSAWRHLVIWDLAAGEELAHLTDFGTFFDTTASLDDEQFAIHLGNNYVRWVDQRTGQSVQGYSIGKSNVTASGGSLERILLSPDGERVAFGESWLTILPTDMLEGFDPEAASVSHVGGRGYFEFAFSPDNTRILGISSSRIAVWDTLSGEQLALLEIPDGHLYNAALFIDADSVLHSIRAINRYSLTLQTATHPELGAFAGMTINGIGSAISSDHRWIAYRQRGFDDNDQGDLQLWDLENGLLMPRFAAHLAEITALTFSPDSSLLVSADETGLLMFWNLKTWENIFVLNAHHGEMTELSFNVDGTQLRTSGLDGQIIVWEVSG